MSTIRYGDVVNAEKTLEGETLEEKLRRRRQGSQDQLQDLEATPEDQQPEINTEHKSK